MELRRGPVARPLLPPAWRRPASLVLAGCAAVTAALALAFTHQGRADGLDAVVDARIRGGLGRYHGALHLLDGLGGLASVTVLTAALVLACLATRRWRGALLALIAVPAAEVVTEYLLKPLVGRVLHGNLVYPSGHTTGVFVLATVVAVLLTGPLRPPVPRMVRLVLIVAAYLIASATATAMIAMGFHYFTDTVGGAAVAIGTVLATALTIDKLAGLQAQRAATREVAEVGS